MNDEEVAERVRARQMRRIMLRRNGEPLTEEMERALPLLEIYSVYLETYKRKLVQSLSKNIARLEAEYKCFERLLSDPSYVVDREERVEEQRYLKEEIINSLCKKFKVYSIKLEDLWAEIVMACALDADTADLSEFESMTPVQQEIVSGLRAAYKDLGADQVSRFV